MARARPTPSPDKGARVPNKDSGLEAGELLSRVNDRALSSASYSDPFPSASLGKCHVCILYVCTSCVSAHPMCAHLHMCPSCVAIIHNSILQIAQEYEARRVARPGILELVTEVLSKAPVLRRSNLTLSPTHPTPCHFEIWRLHASPSGPLNLLTNA